MSRLSTHGTPSAATTSATTVVRPAISPLLITRRNWNTMFCAGSFQFLGVIALFFVTAFGIFFTLPKRVFHLFQFIRVKPLGFVFAGGLFVHVRVTHRLHQFLAHGDHLL